MSDIKPSGQPESQTIEDAPAVAVPVAPDDIAKHEGAKMKTVHNVSIYP
jgi:hypothetical protein